MENSCQTQHWLTTVTSHLIGPLGQPKYKNWITRRFFLDSELSVTHYTLNLPSLPKWVPERGAQPGGRLRCTFPPCRSCCLKRYPPPARRMVRFKNCARRKQPSNCPPAPSATLRVFRPAASPESSHPMVQHAGCPETQASAVATEVPQVWHSSNILVK